MTYQYQVRAIAQLEAIFFTNDQRIIYYFGKEKFETTAKEVLLKQMIEETDSIRNWDEIGLDIEITEINE